MKDKIATIKTTSARISSWIVSVFVLIGALTVVLGLHIFLNLKPIADISALHCVNLIKEESRLTEYAGLLDVERQLLDEREEKLKAGKDSEKNSKLKK